MYRCPRSLDMPDLNTAIYSELFSCSNYFVDHMCSESIVDVDEITGYSLITHTGWRFGVFVYRKMVFLEFGIIDESS